MNTELKQLLLAYITKSASPSETARAKAWIASSDENEASFISLYETYHKNLATQHQFIDNDKAYTRFLAEQSTKSKTKRIYVALSYAAVFLMFLGIGLVFYKTHNVIENQKITVEIAKGKKNKMVLPDGTTVYINAGSTLKYDKEFNNTNRKVYLDGEAYFDIAKSKRNIPFIVDAGGYIVRDIGTVFKIKSYSQDNDFEFSVLSGEISIEDKTTNKRKIFLTKNQSVKINNQQKAPLPLKSLEPKLKIEKLAIEAPQPDELYKEWLSGTLTFDNTNLDELVHALEREFNLSIIIADSSLLSYHYSGAFKNVKNPYVILDIIKQTTPITYTTSGETITITKLTNH